VEYSKLQVKIPDANWNSPGPSGIVQAQSGLVQAPIGIAQAQSGIVLAPRGIVPPRSGIA
jgi:hypothetical protein